MDLNILNQQTKAALRAGDTPKAEALIRQLAAARPGHPQVVLLSGLLRSQQGRHEEAVRLLESLLRLPADHTTTLLHLGNSLQALGRFKEALERYDAALTGNADNAEVLNCRGNALTALGRFEEALADFNTALALETRQAALWYNRAGLLMKINRPGEALADYERAVDISPEFAQALDGQGTALLSLRQPALALPCFEQALALKPADTAFRMNHAVALVHLGRFGEALEDYDRILAIDPDFPKLQGQIALAALYAGDWKRMAAIAPNIPAQIQAGIGGFDPWTLMGYGFDGALVLTCAHNRLRETMPSATPALWTGEKYRHDRTRLAYVSGDFRNHPVGLQIVEVLERHDRARYELIAISVGEDDGSDIRTRLAGAFDQFHDLAGKSDEEVAQTMRSLEVDIAIDLSGHTQGNCLSAFAHRPAPVQVTWLGHPGTTGGTFMDYVLADEIVAPPDHQPFYSEKIIALEDSYFPLDTSRRLGTCPTRAEAGLPEKAFVFCSFNRDWKIAQAVFDMWLGLLRQVPDSVLWLRAPMSGTGLHLPKRAAELGIDPARLVFADAVTPDVHLARHALADLFLDTQPYGAHATAADALWAGLPVLTQLGASFPGRVGASLLTATGLPELIARSAEEYESMALALARDPARLKVIRERLAANRAGAPLFDMTRFARKLEAAYDKMLAERV